MRTLTRLAAFGALLALLVAGGWAAGWAIGPDRTAAPAAAEAPEHAESPAAGHGGGTAEAAELLPGLAASRDGYTLIPLTPTLTAGAPTPFAFRIDGPNGAPVTAFDEEHTKRLHLIVVRRDTAGFQHVHPTMDLDGTWRIPLTVPAGGSYRAFADFTPTGGTGLTLGVDLSAAGDFTPLTPAPSRVAEVDGYRVQLDGELVPGTSTPLTLTVTRDGRPVSDLQPYLGAYGHLVALRQGDLAYLHVHPDGEPGDGISTAGPQIRFVVEVPTGGDYRLFLDFQHGDVVRTAEFTVATGAVGDGPVEQSEHGHG